MRYWLMKSEPDEVSIDDLEARRTVPWFGVRNYQARNFMRDAMQVGDLAFFYHSGCPVPGIAGLCEVTAPAHPDLTQFDPASPYFDAKSSPDDPRWVCVDVRFLRKTRLVPLAELREHVELAAMPVLQRGNRLSITPVGEAEWRFVTERLMRSGS
ncbi:MAG: EVE domain-containing protein [Candidatus Accumulibacter sp. 66-26]|nr:EVE domain-containing protein [Accumulibacter sp.]OJW49436.1 MAG: EVE domain-containing protein [Candidatus Accumulibacter sp. 66-26]